MVFSGYDGKIELCEGCVKIWKGKNDSGHTVKLSDIMFVTLCKPGLTCAGCLFIQVLGAKTYKSWANATHYATDINAVCFRKPQYEEAIQFKEALEAALSHHKEAGTSTEINVAALKDLKQLLDEGIITEDDYNKKKNQILGILPVVVTLSVTGGIFFGRLFASIKRQSHEIYRNRPSKNTRNSAAHLPRKY